MEILKLSYSKLTVDELSVLGNRISDILNTAPPETTNIIDVRTRFENCLGKFNTHMHPLRGSKLTESICQLDDDRDRLSCGLFTYAKSFTFSLIVDEVIASNLILNHFYAQGYPFTQANYTVQSSKITDFIVRSTIIEFSLFRARGARCAIRRPDKSG